MISPIIGKSGIIIATGRKSALRLSGSSARPAYPGFIVMKMLQRGLRVIQVSSKRNLSFFWLLAV